jgi:predicted transcriptional regulator
MSKNDLRSIKKEHLDFLKSIRERKGITENVNSRLYLDTCIELIEQELIPKKNHMERTKGFHFNTNLSKELGLTEMFDQQECDVIAVLLSNSRPIPVGDLSLIANMQRGMCYRTLARLLEYGMVMKAGVTEKSLYIITNKTNPVKPMIDYLNKKLQDNIDKLSCFKVEKILV